MKISAVIPARYASTRFQGKPLAIIDGKTMIERVYRQVEKEERFSRITVATDDIRIFNEVKRFGGRVQMTSTDIKSGTDRVWEVIRSSDCDAVINVQGDEPLISEALISSLYDSIKNEKVDVVTAAWFNESYNEFLSQHVVKVVVCPEGEALYFSRSPIPFCEKNKFKGFFHHIGIYGYTRNALRFFVQAAPSELEKTEKLEQIRFLENHKVVRVISTGYRSSGVDIPEDIEKIEKILKGINE